MLTITRTFVCTLLIAGIATLSFAKENRFPVEIIDLSTGKVGSELVKEIKAQIDKTEMFRFTEQREIRLQLRVQTQELQQSDGAPLTIYSIAFTLAHSKQTGDQSVFLSQSVNHCGNDDLKKTASHILKQTIGARAAIQERILAILDGRIESLAKTYSAN